VKDVLVKVPGKNGKVYWRKVGIAGGSSGKEWIRLDSTFNPAGAMDAEGSCWLTLKAKEWKDVKDASEYAAPTDFGKEPQFDSDEQIPF